MSNDKKTCENCSYYHAYEHYILGLCRHPFEFGEESPEKIVKETDSCRNWEQQTEGETDE